MAHPSSLIFSFVSHLQLNGYKLSSWELFRSVLSRRPFLFVSLRPKFSAIHHGELQATQSPCEAFLTPTHCRYSVTVLTAEDVRKEGFACWRELTSTLPSGIHLVHNKAFIQDKTFLQCVTSFLDVTLYHGIAISLDGVQQWVGRGFRHADGSDNYRLGASTTYMGHSSATICSLCAQNLGFCSGWSGPIIHLGYKQWFTAHSTTLQHVDLINSIKFIASAAHQLLQDIFS